MGLSRVIHRWAFARPTALPVVAPGGGAAWHELLDAGAVTATQSPHDADLLVTAGEVPAGWNEPILRLFETMALPRVAVALGGRVPGDLPASSSLPEAVAALSDPEAAPNHPVLPDEPPSPWRGLGDHGQGGEGMMGGKPYGRPMAMTGPDPDGLALSDTPVTLGPFFPPLPPGLVLRLRKQGQRIRQVEAVEVLAPPPLPGTVSPRPIAELEAERIERRMLACSGQLALMGMPALAERFRRRRKARDPSEIARLFRQAERCGIHRLLRGIGRLDPSVRPAPVDPRLEDEGYRGLELSLARVAGTDAWARWQAGREEALQSARLVRSAGDRITGVPLRHPGGSGRLPDVLASLLTGALWSEALLAVASLDLEVTEAAA